MKKKGDRIVSLTAYDYAVAYYEEKTEIDFILVGDSLAMTVFGEETTLSATMDLMIAHTKAVRKGAPATFIVGDMPFGSYQLSDEHAVANAVRFLAEGGADAVKLEGGSERSIKRVKAIVDSGIPVMAHLGLLPQSVRISGYRVVRGEEQERILKEAENAEKAGAFAIVLEGMEEELARLVTGKVSIPTIGIGAGRYTDGQILVVNDMLGLTPEFHPKFVKKYSELGQEIIDAVGRYCKEVRNGEYPEKKHTYDKDR